MSLNYISVKQLFDNLSKGNSDAFFSQVSDNVTWVVMGTHPLAGTYHSKNDFLDHTFRRLNKILKEGVVLEVKNIYIDKNTAIVEMLSLSTAINGKPFNNTYCWVVKFEEDKIVEVHAYVDSSLVEKVIAENE